MAPLHPTLVRHPNWGGELHILDREAKARKTNPSPRHLQSHDTTRPCLSSLPPSLRSRTPRFPLWLSPGLPGRLLSISSWKGGPVLDHGAMTQDTYGGARHWVVARPSPDHTVPDAFPPSTIWSSHSQSDPYIPTHHLNEVLSPEVTLRTHNPKAAKEAWARCLLAVVSRVTSRNDTRAWTDLVCLPKLVL